MADQLDQKILAIERTVQQLRQEFDARISQLRQDLSGGTAPAASDSSISSMLRASIARLGAAGSQSAVLSVLLEEATRYSSRAAFLLFDSQTLKGWGAAGFGGGISDLEELSFGSQSSPGWRQFSEAKGAVELSAADSMPICEYLGSGSPESGFAIPFVLRGQLAGGLYCDQKGPGSIDLAALQILAHSAGQAVETLPLREAVSPIALLLAGAAGHEDDSAAEATTSAPPAAVEVEEPAPTAEFVEPLVEPVEPVGEDAPEMGLPSLEPEPELEPDPAGFQFESIKPGETQLPAVDDSLAPLAPPVSVDAVEPELAVESEPRPSSPAFETESAPTYAPVEPPEPHEPMAPMELLETTQTAPESVATTTAAIPEVSELPYSEPEPAPPAPEPEPEPEAEPMAPVEPPAASVPVTPKSSTMISPPADLEGPGSAFSTTRIPSEVVQDAVEQEAQRLARLLVSEIKLYNEEEVEAGRQSQDIYARLREDIDRSQEIYNERVEEHIRQAHDYFHDELVRILAGGEAAALGM